MPRPLVRWCAVLVRITVLRVEPFMESLEVNPLLLTEIRTTLLSPVLEKVWRVLPTILTAAMPMVGQVQFLPPVALSTATHRLGAVTGTMGTRQAPPPRRVRSNLGVCWGRNVSVGYAYAWTTATRGWIGLLELAW